ncbi:MAG: metallophosphoesterase [Lachnospiraceae bacterium]|nr:metallophosphoesterase [Lachnospiraceae bacterium]
MKKNKVIAISMFGFVICLFLALGFYDRLELTQYDVYCERLPEAFNGYKILQISDFHCQSIGDNEDELIKTIKESAPDIIVLTGDMIDGEHSIDNMIHLLKGIREIAPIYAVSGNHEEDDAELRQQLREAYSSYGVHDVDDSTVVLNSGQDQIAISGLTWDKYTLAQKDISDYDVKYPEKFNVLLYHYANSLDQISQTKYDIAFSGHLHGGIVRLPFVGGILGYQDMFPKYDAGVFYENNTYMVVSRGIGEAKIPRFFNRSELVEVTLYTKLQ